MKKFSPVLALILTVFAPPAFTDDINPASVRQSVEFAVNNSADRSNDYRRAWSQVPSVMTYVNGDGVSVCTFDQAAHNTVVFEYSGDLEPVKTMEFQGELPRMGAFTKDTEGNYYFFYGRLVSSNDRNAENMIMVKYDPQGVKLLSYKLKAYAPSSFHGIRVPFDAAACRLEISGNMIAVYFGREMFDGHQASYGFVLNKDTFERVDRGATTNASQAETLVMPYASHSFNQFILPIEGGFVFADHGDAYPRCFTFAKFHPGGRTKRAHAFKFEGAVGQNATYAQLGGLAKTPGGYIFTGTYGRSSRNLFILTFDENLSACSKPVYITAYTAATGHAAHPKITALEEGYLLMWEFFTSTGYESTYMLIIDEQGKALSPMAELPGIRLNMNDVLRYNQTNGRVYWSVNEGQTVITYALNPGK
ncbi:MAG: hypothetical protein LBQ88_09805 [Treponema sp.]|nr:hypothetical protein [Treponema sp.]